MDPKYLKKIALDLKLKNVKAYYNGGFSVWLENNSKINIVNKSIVKLIWIFGKIANKLTKKESKLLSPYIVLEANL